MTRYNIHELSEETGVTQRNIRSYIDQGLLPPAFGTTRAAYYTDAHLTRLLDIRRLLLEKNPLRVIKRILDASPTEAIIKSVRGDRRRVLVFVEIGEGMWVCYEPSARWQRERNLMEVIEAARDACGRVLARSK